MSNDEILNKSTNGNTPLISVCMPVYNRGMYIRDCIESVLSQSFRNFEFVIVDDGSTDETPNIIDSYCDSRIRCIHNKHDYIGSCNLLLKEAKGKYIARIDSDDIMSQDRLQIQFEYMESHPDVSVLGTGIHVIGEVDSPYDLSFVQEPTLDFMYKNGAGVANPSVMMRRDDIDRYKIKYEKEFIFAEDFCFWVRCLMAGLKIYNLQRPLTQYRHSASQVSVEKSFLQYKAANRVKSLISRWMSKEEEQWAQNHPLSIPRTDNLLTVIIPFLNEGEEVGETVKSIRQYVGTKVDIIVINDQSNDGYDYRSDLQELSVYYIYNVERRGVAASRDLGIRLCQTPFFLLLDAHMRFYDGLWVDRICSILMENDRRLLCCQTKFLSKKKGKVSESLECPSTFGAVFDMRRLSYVDWNYYENNLDSSQERIEIVLGAGYAASKRYWSYLEGLEGLMYYGNDEAFISLKVWLEGGECILLKDVVIGHIYRESSPFKRFSEEELYNHLFIANMLFPISMSCKIHAQAMVSNRPLYNLASCLLGERKELVFNLKRNFWQKKTIPFSSAFPMPIPVSKENVSEAKKILERMDEFGDFVTSFNVHDLGLCQGKMALLVWMLNFGTRTNNSQWMEHAQLLWQEISDSIREREVCWNFKHGLCGIGWGIIYLYLHGLIDELPCEIIDMIDSEVLAYDPDKANTDNFEYGVGGFLAYVTLRNQLPYKSPFMSIDYSESARKILAKSRDVASCTYACWYLACKNDLMAEDSLPSIFDWSKARLFLPQNKEYWDVSVKGGCISTFILAAKVENNKKGGVQQRKLSLLNLSK